jgi:hypothetical protein
VKIKRACLPLSKKAVPLPAYPIYDPELPFVKINIFTGINILLGRGGAVWEGWEYWDV